MPYMVGDKGKCDDIHVGENKYRSRGGKRVIARTAQR